MIISVFDRVESIMGKGEIACTSNFSFSHNVFRRLLSQTRQKVSLCGNRLTKYQILDLSKLKAFADVKTNMTQILKLQLRRVVNIVEKEKKCWLLAFSPIGTIFSKGIFNIVKTCDCVAKS